MELVIGSILSRATAAFASRFRSLMSSAYALSDCYDSFNFATGFSSIIFTAIGICIGKSIVGNSMQMGSMSICIFEAAGGTWTFS